MILKWKLLLLEIGFKNGLYINIEKEKIIDLEKYVLRLYLGVSLVV